MEKYICKYCGRKGTKEELLHHICKRGIEKHYEDEDESFLSTLILVDAITSFDLDSHGSEGPVEPLQGGGGEFGGGGASGEFGSSESESSESESSESESDSSCDSDGG